MLTIPIEFLRAYDLKPGDAVLWHGTEDGLALEFFRVPREDADAVVEEEATGETTEHERTDKETTTREEAVIDST